MSFAIARRRLVTLVGGTAATAALATGLAACGGSSADTTSSALSPLSGLAPADAVQTAFENLGQASTVHAKVHLDLSQGASDSMTKGDDPMTPTQAAALRNGSLDFTVTAPQGETVGQVMTATKDQQGQTPASVDVAVNTDQGQLVGLRSVGGNLYAMGDLKQLSSLSGEDLSSEATRLGNQSAALAPITSALVAGKWLEISSTELKSLENLMDIGVGASGIDPKVATSAEQDLKAALTKDVTWTAGATPGTYDATVSANALVADLYPDLQQFARIGGQPLPSKQETLGEIPAGTNISVEVATAGDQVSSVTLDALQFDHDAADVKELGPDPKVDVVATFDTTTAPVTAPTDVVSLDKQIPALLMQFGAANA